MHRCVGYIYSWMLIFECQQYIISVLTPLFLQVSLLQNLQLSITVPTSALLRNIPPNCGPTAMKVCWIKTTWFFSRCAVDNLLSVCRNRNSHIDSLQVFTLRCKMKFSWLEWSSIICLTLCPGLDMHHFFLICNSYSTHSIFISPYDTVGTTITWQLGHNGANYYGVYSRQCIPCNWFYLWTRRQADNWFVRIYFLWNMFQSCLVVWLLKHFNLIFCQSWVLDVLILICMHCYHGIVTYPNLQLCSIGWPNLPQHFNVRLQPGFYPPDLVQF